VCMGPPPSSIAQWHQSSDEPLSGGMSKFPTSSGNFSSFGMRVGEPERRYIESDLEAVLFDPARLPTAPRSRLRPRLIPMAK
jgi:hypothetical protein